MHSQNAQSRLTIAAAASLFFLLPMVAWGQVTNTYQYDSMWQRDFAGQPVTSVDGLGRTTTYTYQYVTGDGELTQTVDRNGSSIRYTYDPNFNQTGSITTSGDPTTSTYDPNSGGVTLTDTNGPNSTTYIYDANNNPVSSFNTTGDVVSSAYDADNNRLAESEAGPSGMTTTYLYDTNNNPASSITTPGDPIATTYDYVGHELAITTDTAGRATTFTYDSSGAPLTQITDPNGTARQFTYDSQGNLIGAFDTNGITTIYQYNPGPQTWTPESIFSGVVVGMAYDPVGKYLYVSTLPEPGAITLLALSGLTLLRRRRGHPHSEQ